MSVYEIELWKSPERIRVLEAQVAQLSTEMGRMERDLADLLRWKQREENGGLVGL
jgi:hypothetical protein